jgi:cytochrome c5
MTKTDSVFLKQFSQIIAGLVAFTLILIVGAYIAHQRFYSDPERGIGADRAAVALERADAQIKPIGALYAGEQGRIAMLAAEEAERKRLASMVAYGGTLDGSVIYQKLCVTCHAGGTGGAPLMTKAAWAARVSKGEETLIKHAIEGFKGEAGVMPARGGNGSLNDEQVTVAVQWMLANLN